MTTGAAAAPNGRLLLALAAWWLATAVLPGSALQSLQPPQFGQSSTQARVRSSRDDVIEQDLADGFEPCPDSSDADTLAKLNRSLRRWRGKTIAVVGDSLTDHVYESLACSGLLSGAVLPLAFGYGWPQNRPVPLTEDRIPRDQTRHPVRFNRLAFEEEEGRESVVTLQQNRFFDFPCVRDLPSQELDDFWDTAFDQDADVILLNLAHEAYFWLDRTENVTRDIIRAAESRGLLGKLVMFGHPPQHFDTPSGEYTLEAYNLGGGCHCHGQRFMERQPSWGTNKIMRRVAQEFKIPYISPWDYYAQGCNHHKDEHDCTHFLPTLSLHVDFVEALLQLAEKRIGMSVQ